MEEEVVVVDQISLPERWRVEDSRRFIVKRWAGALLRCLLRVTDLKTATRFRRVELL